CTFV
ncbi:hypothetical protein ACN38_g13246, partial [Penicillium nordicum]